MTRDPTAITAIDPPTFFGPPERGELVETTGWMTDISPESKLDASRWLDEFGDALYRFALKRVGSSDVAEDLVQETFMAALRSVDRFEGRSQVQTWLTSILRNKITDHMRKLGRERKRAERDRSEQEPTIFKNGKWIVGVHQWDTSEVSKTEAQEFWLMLNSCMEKLPDKLLAAFRMRDVEELAMKDICEALDITSSNLSVRLHRARLLLRDCIDRNWFLAGGSS